MASQMQPSYFYPHETLPHQGTLMTWPTTHSIPPGSNITSTRLELASIALTIARHEPVQLFVRDDHDNLSSARQMLAADSANITIHATPSVFSLWARDTGPVFVRNRTDNSVAGIVLNFNNWGAKLPRNADSHTATSALSALKIPSISTTLTAEGGGLEFDGDGTLVATESCLINKNRNPGMTKADLESEFARLFGVQKTIWLRGSKGTDITDAHVDALARFVKPGVVLLSRPGSEARRCDKRMYENARSVLMQATDARGRSIRVVEVPEPDDFEVVEGEMQDYGSDLCVTYANYYVCNGAIIMAAFGDKKADANARTIIESLYPGRVVEQVPLRELASQGGGIHCATQQIV